MIYLGFSREFEVRGGNARHPQDNLQKAAERITKCDPREKASSEEANACILLVVAILLNLLSLKV